MPKAAKPEPVTLRVEIESVIKSGDERHGVYLVRSDCPKDGPKERHRIRVLFTPSQPHALAIKNQFETFLSGPIEFGTPVLADYLARARAMVIATSSSILDACHELEAAAIDEMDRMLAAVEPEADRERWEPLLKLLDSSGPFDVVANPALADDQIMFVDTAKPRPMSGGEKHVGIKETVTVQMDEFGRKASIDLAQATEGALRSKLVEMGWTPPPAPVDDGTWLVVDSHMFSNDRVWFWKRGRNGYTTNVAEAHYFTKEEAELVHRQRSTDVPVLLADMITLAQQNVRADHFHQWNADRNQWVIVDVLASNDADEGKTMKLWLVPGCRTRLLAEAAKMTGPAARSIAFNSSRKYSGSDRAPGPERAHQVKDLQPLVDASGQIPWAAYMAKFGGGQ